jgi:predicted TIM-barrel enzyme
LSKGLVRVTVIVAKPFETPKPIIGRVALLPLAYPGNAASGVTHLSRLVDRAEQEAMAWLSAGVDGLLVENTLQPCQGNTVPDWLLVAMTLTLQRVVRLSTKPVGVSVIDNHPHVAETLAWGTGATWLRVPVGVGCRVTAGGMQAAQLPQHTLTYPLYRVADVTPDHWLPTLPHNANAPALTAQLNAQLNAMAAVSDACVVKAGYLADGLANTDDTLINSGSTAHHHVTPHHVTSHPIWVEDDGHLPMTGHSMALWQQVDGVLLGPSALKSLPQSASYQDTGSTEIWPTVDPYKAQAWVQGIRSAWGQYVA